MQDAAAPITHRRVLKIALPIVLPNAAVPILGAVDTGGVGQMGQAASIGALVGGGAVGARDRQRVRRASVMASQWGGRRHRTCAGFFIWRGLR